MFEKLSTTHRLLIMATMLLVIAAVIMRANYNSETAEFQRAADEVLIVVSQTMADAVCDDTSSSTSKCIRSQRVADDTRDEFGGGGIRYHVPLTALALIGAIASGGWWIITNNKKEANHG